MPCIIGGLAVVVVLMLNNLFGRWHTWRKP